MSTKKTCFFVTPIGKPGSSVRKQSDYMYNLIQGVLNNFNYGQLMRADFDSRGGNITTQVIELLLNADLVIADISGGNANVFYELGIRHATNRPYIQIVNEKKDEVINIPFDLSQVRTIIYHYNDHQPSEPKKEKKPDPMDVEQKKSFLVALSDFIRSCELRPFEIKNPLTDIDSIIPLRSESEPVERIMADIICDLAEGIKLFQPPNIKAVRGMTKDSQAPFIKSVYQVLEDTRDNITDLKNGVINCSGPLINNVFQNFMDHVEHEFKAISVNDIDFWLREEGTNYLNIPVRHKNNHDRHNRNMKLERIFVVKDDYFTDQSSIEKLKQVFEKQVISGVNVRVARESVATQFISNVSRLDFGLFDTFAVSFFRQTKGRLYTVSTSKNRCEKYHRQYDKISQICLKVPNKKGKEIQNGMTSFVDETLIECIQDLEDLFMKEFQLPKK
ncbi:MAG: hypothetical protein JNK77_03015 [Saprospiraceae bacterium]|nr:hypothetical protein [Saprospiraceae bacterium]